MTIFSSNYISRKPIDRAMKRFARRFLKEQRVLDIGCGKKPYRPLFACDYVGLDADASVNPDIVADAWNIPLPDSSFDGIILNQSLEHIAETTATINEVKRLLKTNGLVIVTVPHAMRNHSSPLNSEKAPVHNFNTHDHRTWRVDYFRFTKFGLMYIFRDFQTESIRETSGYFGTLSQLVNYFFASIGPEWLFFPLYAINNVLGLSADAFFYALSKLPISVFQKLHEHVYQSLPVNYVCIFVKK